MSWKADARKFATRKLRVRAIAAGLAIVILPSLYVSLLAPGAGLSQWLGADSEVVLNATPKAASETVGVAEATPSGATPPSGGSEDRGARESVAAKEDAAAGGDEDVASAGAQTPTIVDVNREAAAGPQPESPAAVAAAAVEEPEPATLAKRVGIQAGHWRSAELPAELAGLRTSTGTFGGGVSEWQLNLDIAKRVAPLLEAEGIDVDVLPATIPPGYVADAFVALHADGDLSGRLSGFKLATPRTSAVTDLDNALLAAITAEYQAATGMRLDYNITRNMTGYYAFGFRRFTHAITRTTPAVIVEMGFLTNATDRSTLLGRPDVVADGVARGVLRFLAERER